MVMTPLLTLVLLASQSQGAVITATLPAQSVSQALVTLSSSAGVKLTAVDPVAHEIVALRLDKVPLTDLMQKVASATAAEWQPIDGGFRLVRTAEIVRRLQDAARAAETAKIREALAKLTSLDSQPWDDDTARSVAGRLHGFASQYEPQRVTPDFWSNVQKAQRTAPAGRAMTRAIGLLNAAELAALPVGSRVIFSSQPNTLQRALHGDANALLETYYREQAPWAAAVSQTFHDGGNDNVALMNDVDRKPLAKAPAKLLVAATRMGHETGLSLELILAADDGQIVGQSSLAVNETPEVATAPALQADGDAPLVISPSVTSFAKRLKNLATGTIDAELRAQILEPEKTDPLSLVASEALLKSAEKRNENMVACLPDSALWQFAVLVDQPKLTPSAVLRGTGEGEMSVVEQGGWAVISPKWPLQATADRVSRPALGVFLRSAEGAGRIGLDDLAAFAFAVPSEQAGDFGTTLAAALIGRHGNEQMNDWKSLRLYGSLSASQRQSLQSGPIDLRTLTGQQGEALRSLLFDGASQLSYDPAVASPNLSEQATAQFEQDQEIASSRFSSSIFQEATESVPTSYVAQGTLSMSDVHEDCIFGSGHDGGMSFDNEAMTPESVALAFFTQSRHDLFPWAGTRTMERFATGSHRQITFQIHPTKRLVQSISLDDNAIAAGNGVAMSELPADIRKKIDAELAKVALQYKDYKPGDFGGPARGKIPPP